MRPVWARSITAAATSLDVESGVSSWEVQSGGISRRKRGEWEFAARRGDCELRWHLFSGTGGTACGELWVRAFTLVELLVVIAIISC